MTMRRFERQGRITLAFLGLLATLTACEQSAGAGSDPLPPGFREILMRIHRSG
jgi:hypothetical protein